MIARVPPESDRSFKRIDPEKVETLQAPYSEQNVPTCVQRSPIIFKDLALVPLTCSADDARWFCASVLPGAKTGVVILRRVKPSGDVE